MKVLLAFFEPRRDRDPDRLTLRSKANPHREQQAVIEPADQDSGRYEPKLHAHDSIHQAVMALVTVPVVDVADVRVSVVEHVVMVRVGVRSPRRDRRVVDVLVV